MTSYTKKLYNRDPQAALAFYSQNEFEQKAQFGKRTPSLTVTACSQLCNHPACSHGCTDAGLRARRMAFLEG